jgi:hypothetical protein
VLEVLLGARLAADAEQQPAARDEGFVEADAIAIDSALAQLTDLTARVEALEGAANAAANANVAATGGDFIPLAERD